MVDDLMARTVKRVDNRIKKWARNTAHRAHRHRDFKYNEQWEEDHYQNNVTFARMFISLMLVAAVFVAGAFFAGSMHQVAERSDVDKFFNGDIQNVCEMMLREYGYLTYDGDIHCYEAGKPAIDITRGYAVKVGD